MKYAPLNKEDLHPVAQSAESALSGIQVSKPTFLRALEEKRAVMMVPGGQAELVHTWRFFKRKEFVIYTKHKGNFLFRRSVLPSAQAVEPYADVRVALLLREFFQSPCSQTGSKTVGGTVSKNSLFSTPSLAV